MKKKIIKKDPEYLRGMTEEQQKDFEELFLKYYTYVYKYEVGYEEDFKPDACEWQWNRNSFLHELYDAGMTIKVVDGY